ncbi:hypothetical protein [Streptomyces sp. ATE26]|uniref:vWA-MoxR associated conflict system protein n=1 Tax=Streptomyces sp. ATE26 TaxID=2954237 RepID=UPI00248247B5|nr:hypothetical protein [Streptomyces sp. ATE26]
MIATQCPAAKQHLSNLVTRADELHRLLTDPEIGACLPSEPGGGRALRSGEVTRQQIEDAVRAAAERADEEGAVLVLAFLGHGQTPLGHSKLYYMAYDTQAEQAASSVELGTLLFGAGDPPGVKGVIALIDTCHAGAGVPDTQDLAGGFSLGKSRYSLLMAAAATQNAYDLDFSGELASLLRDGVPRAGELLRSSALKLALSDRILRQNCQVLDWDGDPDAVEELWVAMNRRQPTWTPGRRIGDLGSHDLHEALDAWPEHSAPVSGWDHPGLRELCEQAADSAAPGALRVGQVAHGLVHAGMTSDMVHAWAGRALTTPALRSVVADLNAEYEGARPPLDALRPPKWMEGSALLQYVLEHAALRISVTGDPVARLARAVAAIADRCGLSTDDEQVQDWVRNLRAEIELTDANARQTALRQDRRWRLVISLHAAQVDWPETVSVWLRDGGRGEYHEVHNCEPTRTGVERLLPEIIGWARKKVPEGTRITNIDVVVPAPLLLTWEPEKAPAGRTRLGTRNTVVLRWAGRLAVPGFLAGMNEEDRDRLKELSERSPGDREAPLDWLSEHDTRDAGALAERLRLGCYERAIGLDHRPPNIAELMEVLLTHTPILLWPRTDSDVDISERDRLGECWDRLPDQFSEAYRHRWSAEAGGLASPVSTRDEHLGDLARLRAAWHDLDWLDFCGWFEQHHPTDQWSA